MRDLRLPKTPEKGDAGFEPAEIRGMSVHMAAGLRGFLLAAVTIGIPVLWAFVPYAYRVGEMQYMTFGSITLKATRHIAEHRDWHPQYALGLPIFLGLLVPLYPALQAARLLIAPSQLAARRRWVWFVEGPALLLLSLAGWWQADWALEDWNWGATAPPVLYPPFWLLPGGVVLAGLLALAIGIAPLSRVARFVLGAAAKPAMLGPVGTNSTIGSSTPSPMSWPRTLPAVFALCGVATGAVAAAVCTVAKFGEVEPFAVAGYCLGVEVSGAGLFEGGACTGVDGAFYLFPGLVFGIVFGPLLHRCGRLSRGGATGYAVAAVMANAVAVTVCVSALHPLNDLLPFDNPILDLAVAGMIAGAAGGGLLCMIFRSLALGGVSIRPGIVIGGALGMLAPLILSDAPGGFAFYMIWQGGYGAAVAAGLHSEG
jgi:hypothetical protein